MGALLQDVRYGLRMLGKNPGFAAVAVVTLALGIGANTAIFTLVNAVLLNPLPVKDVSRLVELDTTDKKTFLALGNATHLGVSFANYRDYARQASVFTGLAAFAGPLELTLSGRGEPKQVQGSMVTANYFDLLGVPAALGRTFTPDEDQKPGGNSVAVLSYGLWSREFGADPGIIGKPLTLNGYSYTVIGVTGRGFKGTFLFSSADQIWIPVSMHSQVLAGFIEDNFEDRRFLDFQSFGRLKPGVTIREADAAVATIASRLETQFPKDNAGRSAVLSPLSDAVLGIDNHAQVTLAGDVLMAVVGLVLLIACLNLANLLLAQMARREREMCLRAALGAGGARLVRQSLTESLVLALLGGAAGLVIAYWGKALLWSHRPAFMAQTDLALSLDGRVLAFALGVTILTGVLFGILPAFKAARTDLNEALKSSGRGGTMAWGRSRFRQLLVISEVALALIALAGAGLFLRSLSFAAGIDPGFETKRLFTLNFDLGSQHYDQGRGEQFFRDAVAGAEAVPGARSAAVGSIAPLIFGGGVSRTVFLEGQDASTGQRGALTTIDDISTGYFRTLGIPLKRGRFFSDLDRKQTTPVAIVNTAMARHFWPGQDPLGKRFHFIDDPTLREVVGEVGDTVEFQIGEIPQPVAYLPMTQDYSPFAVLMVRTEGDPRPVMAPVHDQVQSLDRNLALTNVATIGETLSQGLWAPRMGAALLGVFAALALILASVGIYGVLSYSVSQRVQEVGIRMALGATPRQILRLIVGQGMALALTGVVIGTVGALILTRSLSSLLFGVKPADPLTFIVVLAILSAVALLATYIPARRATKVDPLVALRYE
jgi:putative ABC transport system permease protein